MRGERSPSTWKAAQTKTNKAKKQTNPEDAFAFVACVESRYNLDNLYLNIVVSTQALTDRCFDLESFDWQQRGSICEILSLAHTRTLLSSPLLLPRLLLLLLLSRSHSNQNKYGRNKTLKQRNWKIYEQCAGYLRAVLLNYFAATLIAQLPRGPAGLYIRCIPSQPALAPRPLKVHKIEPNPRSSDPAQLVYFFATQPAENK